jgi:hypothetical protein
MKSVWLLEQMGRTRLGLRKAAMSQMVVLSEHNERVSFLRCGSYCPKPSLALGILLVGQDNDGPVKQAFNLSDREPVALYRHLSIHLPFLYQR